MWLALTIIIAVCNFFLVYAQNVCCIYVCIYECVYFCMCYIWVVRLVFFFSDLLRLCLQSMLCPIICIFCDLFTVCSLSAPFAFSAACSTYICYLCFVYFVYILCNLSAVYALFAPSTSSIICQLCLCLSQLFYFCVLYMSSVACLLCFYFFYIICCLSTILVPRLSAISACSIAHLLSVPYLLYLHLQ